MSLTDFIKEKGLKREVSVGSSRIDCEKGDYFITDAGSLGTRIDYEDGGTISRAKYFVV